MARVLVCAGTWAYTAQYPKKELALLRDLQQRGHAARLVALDTHQPGYPAGYWQDPDWRPFGPRRVGGLEALWPHLVWAQVIVVPMHRGSGTICQWAHALNKPVVQHDDHGGMDSHYWGADFVGVKGDWFRTDMLVRSSLPADRVQSIGSLEYDRICAATAQRESRESFCRRYGLDPGKAIAAWLPTSPRRLDEWGRERYRAICQAVERDPSHNLIIKPHPLDYLGYLSEQHLGGRRSWDVIYPQAAVCRPEDALACLATCDVALTIHSTVGLEMALFRRPTVYVDAWATPRVGTRDAVAATGLVPVEHWRTWPVPWVPGFVGLSAILAELPDVLANRSYQVRDPGLYDAHVARFLHADDGLAYRRLADLVEQAVAFAQARPKSLSWAAQARRSKFLAERMWGHALDVVRRARLTAYGLVRHRPN